MQPLANALREPLDTSEEFKAPLQVCLCENCGLSQLTVVVDPEILYKGYRFRSGTSEAWRKHCAELAEQCGEPGKVLDIAANDGTCLRAFRDKGWEVSGIDPTPATDDAALNITQGWWPDYDEYCGYNLIVAQNVLGHVNDPVTFLSAIARHLAEDGQAVIEVPNVGNLIDDCAFDTIYHEHLSYWNGIGLHNAALKAGLSAVRTERMAVHGGSVRYWLEHEPEATDLIYRGLFDFRPYAEFGIRVAQHINKTAHLVDKASRKNFIAWGASAKGAVYLNALHNRWPAVGLPEYVIDETPGKVGLLMPGVRIPIVEPPEFLEDVQVIWVLSWNWFEQIKRQAQLRGFKGKFLVTSPRPLLVD